jgi:hypothetical protein
MRVAIVTGASHGYAVVATSRSIRADIVNVTIQLEEQWSFFVKKCVRNPARATS